MASFSSNKELIIFGGKLRYDSGDDLILGDLWTLNIDVLRAKVFDSTTTVTTTSSISSSG